VATRARCHIFPSPDAPPHPPAASPRPPPKLLSAVAGIPRLPHLSLMMCIVPARFPPPPRWILLHLQTEQSRHPSSGVASHPRRPSLAFLCSRPLVLPHSSAVIIEFDMFEARRLGNSCFCRRGVCSNQEACTMELMLRRLS